MRMKAVGIVMIADAGIVGMRTGNAGVVTAMNVTGVAMDTATRRTGRVLTRGKDRRRARTIKRGVVNVRHSCDVQRFLASVDVLNFSDLISHATSA
jgi:hypothetical protein